MNIGLSLYNPHWRRDYKYPYSKKRDIFADLVKNLSKHTIRELSGLRRVGKSTLMFQCINALIDRGTDPYRILYFTFDDAQPTIEELLSEYTRQTNISIQDQEIYLFLDEVQKLSNFQNQIKVFYDLYPKLHFTVSGSTSLYIRKKQQESLAGRVLAYHIGPLSFAEYLMFREKRELLDRPLINKQELEREFGLYLTSQFIETVGMESTHEKREYVREVIKKIIFFDIPSIYPVEKPAILERIVAFIAQKPGCMINNIHLAQEIGISNQTTAAYLNYLEDAFLLNKLYSFSRNIISAEKRMKKYYLVSPMFDIIYADFIPGGPLQENYVVSMLQPKYFWRDSYGHEVDFMLLDQKQKVIPLEVKWQTTIRREDTSNLILAMKKIGLLRGYLFYNGLEKHTIHSAGKIITLLPFYHPLVTLVK